MNNHTAPDDTIVGYDTLSEDQRDLFAHYRAYNVPAEWFIGAKLEHGAVSVAAVGDTFVWAFQFGAGVTEASAEANFPVDAWTSGITI